MIRIRIRGDGVKVWSLVMFHHDESPHKAMNIRACLCVCCSFPSEVHLMISQYKIWISSSH